MFKKIAKKIIAISLAVICIGAINPIDVWTEPNAKMKISKIEGTVAVINADNKAKRASNNMELESGYSIATNQASYAWINLDDTKLIKTDALSRITVIKVDKNLLVDAVSGKIFFDVSKQLDKDENLFIRTSNTIMNIKGASGEIKTENGNTTIICLDGNIECVTANSVTGEAKKLEMKPGKKAQIVTTDSKISVETKNATKNDISGFTQLQIVMNPVLKERIVEASGSKLGNISVNDAVNSFSKDLIKQSEDVKALAELTGTDPQKAVNALMGADISSNTLNSVATATANSTISAVDSSDESSSSIPESTSESTPESTPTPIPTPTPSEEPKPEGHTHNYVVTSEVAATCTENGSINYKCSTCGATKSEPIVAGHKFTDKIEELLEDGASADNCGEWEIKVTELCSVCGERFETYNGQKFPVHSFNYEEYKFSAEMNEVDELRIYACGNVYGEKQCTVIRTERVSHTFEIPETRNVEIENSYGHIELHCRNIDVDGRNCEIVKSFIWNNGSYEPVE